MPLHSAQYSCTGLVITVTKPGSEASLRHQVSAKASAINRTRDKGHTLKHRRFHSNIRNSFPSEQD